MAKNNDVLVAVKSTNQLILYDRTAYLSVCHRRQWVLDAVRYYQHSKQSRRDLKCFRSLLEQICQELDSALDLIVDSSLEPFCNT